MRSQKKAQGNASRVQPMAGLECVAARVAHRLLHCQVGHERAMSGNIASRHTVSVSAADADERLERDVEALVGGHGGKEGLRGEVAGGSHWVRDVPEAGSGRGRR